MDVKRVDEGFVRTGEEASACTAAVGARGSAKQVTQVHGREGHPRQRATAEENASSEPGAHLASTWKREVSESSRGQAASAHGGADRTYGYHSC